MALRCLKDACDSLGSKLETVQFGKLDFGETVVLDRFYNAATPAVHEPWTATLLLLLLVLLLLLLPMRSK
ncbi:hypothetical protein CRUP_036030 [Coryphaenoides rupestris]|nr:hypothetical protein CRUP_036030 [Coryphaenoides rupestris]